jgi:predicted ATPase
VRVDYLVLPEFRNLRGFTIKFAQDSSRTVLVGRNGVGKTNVLEALTRIFGQLDLHEKPEFAYEIAYQCNGFHVVAESVLDERSSSYDPTFTMRYRVARVVNGESPIYDTYTDAAFYRHNDKQRLFPKHVFGYYSGTATRFRNIFKRHRERYQADLIAGREDSLRPLFLAEDWHSQFVLLAFYSQPDPTIATFLREYLRIAELQSVLFILHEPYWYVKNPSQQVRERGNSRYWWAAGTVKRLLGELHALALAPMSTVERVDIAPGRTSRKEHRYAYLKSDVDLMRLAAGIDQKEFFKLLESTHISDLLTLVRPRFRHLSGASLAFEDLSEGEQQLLTVLGLMRFTNQDESLFLLDEPDTHLNPAWCLDYLDILYKYGGGLTKSQLIMTTHNPLVFAGLQKNEVTVLQRQEEDDSIIADHPASDPKGMGISAILTSEFFGLRAALDRETTELLDEKRQLGSLPERSQLQERKLAELNAIIRELDITYTSDDDPLFTEFVREMSRHEREDSDIAEMVLSPEAVRRRREYAAAVVRRLRGRE